VLPACHGFAARLRQVIRDRGVDVRDVAAGTGLKLATVRGIVAGQQEARAEHIRRLCIALNVSADFLLSGHDHRAARAAPVSLRGLLRGEGA